MIWNHDMSAAPRDPKIKLLVAHPKDGKVYATVWNEGTRHSPQGWWSGFTAAVQPVAWMLWPAHPNHQSDVGEIAAVKGKARLANAAGVEPPTSGLFLLDDVGSGA